MTLRGVWRTPPAAGPLLLCPPPGAISSAGRAPPRQGGGHWFEPSIAHSGSPAPAGFSRSREEAVRRTLLLSAVRWLLEMALGGGPSRCLGRAGNFPAFLWRPSARESGSRHGSRGTSFPGQGGDVF